jgi:RimK-like ATP-grasp domain
MTTMTVTIWTPDQANDAYYADVVQSRIAAHEALFARRGVEVMASPWNEPVDARSDIVFPLLAWGYHLDEAGWRAAVANCPRPLVNPPEALLWNTRKTYLRALEQAGVPIVPTAFVARADSLSVSAGREKFGTRKVVVKPQVSGGAHNTFLLDDDQEPSTIVADAMIQPFLKAVGEEGEWSLFYFQNVFAYAVRKVAAAGDFRVQRELGGRFQRFDPPEHAKAIAVAALNAAPKDLAYARVDLIRLNDGTLALMELEAIEPDLYLDHAPDCLDAVVSALLS